METRYRVFLVKRNKYLNDRDGGGRYRSFRDAKQAFIDSYWAMPKADRPLYEIHAVKVS